MTEQEALQRLKADLLVRGLAASTAKNYSRGVRDFFRFCNRPIENLDVLDVRRFLEHLIFEKRLAPRTVNSNSAAIRFFFAVTLNRTMNYLQIPLMKVPKSLPDLLSRKEVSTLIGACTNVKHRALLLLAYGSGLRSSAIVTLRVRDIDSKEMRIFVKHGKSNRDHYTVLSQTTLEALRDYWRVFRPNSPEGWLFPGTKNVGHLTRAGVAFVFNVALGKTNIQKEVSTHSLRHVNRFFHCRKRCSGIQI